MVATDLREKCLTARQTRQPSHSSSSPPAEGPEQGIIRIIGTFSKKIVVNPSLTVNVSVQK